MSETCVAQYIQINDENKILNFKSFADLSILIEVYSYCYPHTNCFVVSRNFSVRQDTQEASS